MICGVDHVALACTELESAIEALKASGFSVRFIDHDVPNDAGKASILLDYQPLHSMALCDPASGISLELTKHGSRIGPQAGGFQLLLARAPQARANVMDGRAHDIANIWLDAFGHQSTPMAWTPFGSTVWCLDPPADGREQETLGLLLPVPQVVREAEFWTSALGFKEVSSGALGRDGDWKHLRLPAPVPNWSADVILLEDADPSGLTMLDSGGFPCLALLSTNLKDDLARCIDHGGTIGAKPFSVVVAAKTLNVALFRSPGGALIELLSVAR
jgi:hypothetical protein